MSEEYKRELFAVFGTSEPFVARLSYGLIEILDTTNFENRKEIKDAIITIIDPDDIGIDPCDNPQKSNLSLLLSCRLLLELLYIRNVAENLGCDSKYYEFLARIFEFEKELRG